MRADDIPDIAYLNDLNAVYFCESTADFTLKETPRLVGKAFGSAVGADAVLIAMNDDNSRPMWDGCIV